MGKFGSSKRGRFIAWLREQNPYCRKEKGADFHRAFIMRGKSKQKGVIWRKESKGTAKLVSQEGKKNITCVERIWGRGVKRDTLGKGKSEGGKKRMLLDMIKEEPE